MIVNLEIDINKLMSNSNDLMFIARHLLSNNDKETLNKFIYCLRKNSDISNNAIDLRRYCDVLGYIASNLII